MVTISCVKYISLGNSCFPRGISGRPCPPQCLWQTNAPADRVLWEQKKKRKAAMANAG